MANEVQNITLSDLATAGTFTLTFNSRTTTAIVYNATSADIQAALGALFTLGVGNISVSGDAFESGVIVLTFQGVLSDTDVPQISCDASGLSTTADDATATVSLTGGSFSPLGDWIVANFAYDAPSVPIVYWDSGTSGTGQSPPVVEIDLLTMDDGSGNFPQWDGSYSITDFVDGTDGTVTATVNTTQQGGPAQTYAPHYKCQLAIACGLASLGLEGIEPANIVIVKQPLSDIAMEQEIVSSYPMILISPWGQEGMDISQGTNLQDDVEYPCLVSIVAAPETDLQQNHNRYLLWRHYAFTAFRNQALIFIDGSRSMTCRAEPSSITLPQAWTEGLYFSALILRCVIREPRGPLT